MVQKGVDYENRLFNEDYQDILEIFFPHWVGLVCDDGRHCSGWNLFQIGLIPQRNIVADQKGHYSAPFCL